MTMPKERELSKHLLTGNLFVSCPWYRHTHFSIHNSSHSICTNISQWSSIDVTFFGEEECTHQNILVVPLPVGFKRLLSHTLLGSETPPLQLPEVSCLCSISRWDRGTWDFILRRSAVRKHIYMSSLSQLIDCTVSSLLSLTSTIPLVDAILFWRAQILDSLSTFPYVEFTSSGEAGW